MFPTSAPLLLLPLLFSSIYSTYAIFSIFNLFYFLYSRFLLVIYFIHINIYIYTNPNLQIHPTTTTPITLGFPLLVSICVFSTPVSLFLPCKPVRLYHFSRFHIYALIYGICFFLTYFTLYDTL